MTQKFSKPRIFILSNGRATFDVTRDEIIKKIKKKKKIFFLSSVYFANITQTQLKDIRRKGGQRGQTTQTR